MDKKLIGRKLILNWASEDKPGFVIELTKKVIGTTKDHVNFNLFNSDVILANVYQDENGNVIDEPLGKPVGHNGNSEGYTIDQYLINDCFWKMPNECH